MDIKKQIDKLCRQALSASSYSGIYDSKVKNSVLKSISDNLDIREAFFKIFILFFKSVFFSVNVHPDIKTIRIMVIILYFILI